MFSRREPSPIYLQKALISSQQSANIRRGTPKFKMSHIHRRTMFPTCSCNHRRCIFDVIVSPIVWEINRRCCRTALRSINDALAILSPECFIFSVHPEMRTPTEQSDLSFIYDLVRQPQCMWFHVKSLHLFYALHKAL